MQELLEHDLFPCEEVQSLLQENIEACKKETTDVQKIKDKKRLSLDSSNDKRFILCFSHRLMKNISL